MSSKNAKYDWGLVYLMNTTVNVFLSLNEVQEKHFDNFRFVLTTSIISCISFFFQGSLYIICRVSHSNDLPSLFVIGWTLSLSSEKQNNFWKLSVQG